MLLPLGDVCCNIRKAGTSGLFAFRLTGIAGDVSARFTVSYSRVVREAVKPHVRLMGRLKAARAAM